jgi:hypothetical protein
MALNYMALAVPLFLLMIGIEYWVSRCLGRQLFNFNSSIANMNVGVAERLIDMFTAGSFLFLRLSSKKLRAVRDPSEPVGMGRADTGD